MAPKKKEKLINRVGNNTFTFRTNFGKLFRTNHRTTTKKVQIIAFKENVKNIDANTEIKATNILLGKVFTFCRIRERRINNATTTNPAKELGWEKVE
jgi:hypothetical protein